MTPTEKRLEEIERAFTATMGEQESRQWVADTIPYLLRLARLAVRADKCCKDPVCHYCKSFADAAVLIEAKARAGAVEECKRKFKDYITDFECPADYDPDDFEASMQIWRDGVDALLKPSSPPPPEKREGGECRHLNKLQLPWGKYICCDCECLLQGNDVVGKCPECGEA